MIVVDRLSFAYSDKEVLTDISFTVEQKDFFAVLGPNAAGKTTLLKVMTGLLKQRDGKITILNNDLSNVLSNNLKLQIGLMHDISGLYLKMTGFEYLSFIAAMYNYPPEKITKRVSELSTLYKLDTEIHKPIKKYSAGTKKKVEFCATLVHEPKILFLDEPFESVDPSATYIMKKNLKLFVEDGGTVVITSHILESIQNLCNKYIIINGGSIVDEGNMDDLSIDLESRFMEVIDSDNNNKESV